MLMVFFIIPLIIFGLSMAGPIALYIGVLPFVSLFVVVVIINLLQRRFPHHLPEVLRDWNFLPLWMRSLEPIDRSIHFMSVFPSFNFKCYHPIPRRDSISRSLIAPISSVAGRDDTTGPRRQPLH
jgi:sodium-dependent phosphate cotransporter